MMALSRLAIALDTEYDKKSLKMLQEAIPQMVAVLKQAVDEEDEDRITQSFEVFQTLLGCDSSVLNKYFGDVVHFMINLAAEKSLDDDARTQALTFLMQCIRYRKLKMQGLKVGEDITIKCLEMVTEIDDEDADEETLTLPTAALGLLDEMASCLPPGQVVVPLLHALGAYVTSPDPKRRQAGIMALGQCVEGAPDFINTQLHEIFPLVMRLLEDSEVKVRRAALDGVMRIAEELPEEIGKEHQRLIPALVKHMDIAMSNISGADDNSNLDILRASTNCLDSVIEGLETDDIKPYLQELMTRLARLITNDDFKTKAAAIGAIGQVAACSKSAFVPYFEKIMDALSEFVQIKDSQEDLELRSVACDTMGNIAIAVGSKAFQRYVQPLMHATEEAMHLDHAKLKEASYLFWGMMAKVYESDFKPFLEGVLKALFESLETEESDLEVDLGDAAGDLAGKEITIGGKKIKVAELTNDDLIAADDIEDLDNEIDDGSDDDWDDLEVVTAVAQEKEIAVEVLGDILTYDTLDFLPYLEKTVEMILPLLEHSYEGVQKAAISTLFRAYAAVWALQTPDEKDFTPGLPLAKEPAAQIKKLGEIIMTGTLVLWQMEEDRYVVLKLALHCLMYESSNLVCSLNEMMTHFIVNPSSLRCIKVPVEKANMFLIMHFCGIICRWL